MIIIRLEFLLNVIRGSQIGWFGRFLLFCGLLFSVCVHVHVGRADGRSMDIITVFIRLIRCFVLLVLLISHCLYAVCMYVVGK